MELMFLLIRNKDLLSVFCIGLLSILSALGGITTLLWVFGILFAFFLSGYPLTLVFISKPIGIFKRLTLSFAFSLILHYPAGFLNVVLEGKEAAFSPHLTGFLSILTLLTILFCFLAAWRREDSFTLKNVLPSLKRKARLKKFIISILVLSLFLNFYNLGRAEIYGNEYSIGFKAYDLVDGNTPGRDAYFISQKDHSPLALYNTFAAMQILEPGGFYKLQPWMFRFASALTGFMAVLLFYIFAREFLSELNSSIAAGIFASSNYIVWMSRTLLREIFLVFFMLLTLYLFYKFVFSSSKAKNAPHSGALLTGIALGAAMLVKFPAIVLVPTIFVFIIFKRRDLLRRFIFICIIALVVFSPVIVFNIGAYIKTGYMDIAFSKILGLEHAYLQDLQNYPGRAYSLENLSGLIYLLADQYSLPLFLLFVGGAFLSFAKLFNKRFCCGNGYTEEMLGEESGRDIAFLMLIFLLLNILLVWRQGFRSYYLPHLTIPFVLLTIWTLSTIKTKISTALLLALIIYSTFFTYNTHISEAYTFIPSSSGELGTSGSTLPEPSLMFSKSARKATEEYGYSEMANLLMEVASPGDRVLLDESINPLAKEWYFTGKHWQLNYGKPRSGRFASMGVHLGNLSDYPNGDWAVVLANERLAYFKSATNRVNISNESLFSVVKDNSGRDSFYLYKI